MSRANHRHYRTENAIEAYGQPAFASLCHSDPYYSRSQTTEVDRVTCPDCNRKLGAQLLEMRVAGAPKLELVKPTVEEMNWSRGIYKAYRDGELFAYIVTDGSASNLRWKIKTFQVHPEHKDRVWPAHRHMQRDETNQYSADIEAYSKEVALIRADELFELGRLTTDTKFLAEKVAQHKAAKAYAIQRREARKEAIADQLLANDALTEISQAFKGQLSNSQKAGLEAALKLIQKLDPDTL